MRKLSDLPIEEAFDAIYEQGLWSAGRDQPSGGGSYGRVSDEYVALLTRFIRERRIRSILDIGCGDFSIGARIAPGVERYHAVDVSSRIIALNQDRFASLGNVEFRQLNACVEPLPTADLVTVRQVLQHLTNSQIEMILRNIERTGFEAALITEHVSGQTQDFRPNLDLPGHSALTRVAIGSGVVLDAPPFSRRASVAATIPLSSAENPPGPGAEVLRVFLLHPQSE